MEVLSLHPGVTLEQVQANTGFAIHANAALTTTPAERDGVAILRGEVEPCAAIIGRG